MTRHVVIKYNRHGMELILDHNISFEELLEAVCEKFRSSKDFFKDAKMVISFKGRMLSEEETMCIVDAIMENTTLQIVGILDSDSELENRMQTHMEEYNRTIRRQSHGGVQQPVEMTEDMYVQYAMAQNCNAEFYKGNLRSGQALECTSSVTLLGDVNPGAKIISPGDIVVLGALKGNAYAGINGNDNCFILALDMSPIQLQIGQYYAKRPDKEIMKRRLISGRKKTDVEGYSPKIATAQEGTICIETMKSSSLFII